ncbi:MAG: MBL fold metallo-hydrolase [Planctomycetes bacterium]|nr:MBL fold metallo-hydrolase [Planctomycetota bacterium]
MATASPTVTFWGAAHTVTGSMHLVEANGKKLLLDCGLYQGKRAEARARNTQFPFDPAAIDAVILSHAHIDHCGNLPNLVRQGFSGPIYCTPATRDLSAVMLADSAKIQEEDAEYLNKKRPRGESLVQPLYSRKDVVGTMKLFQALSYWRLHSINHDFQVKFVEAGHLLGSAMVQLVIPASPKPRTITFTGDLGRKGMPILRDPSEVPEAELLISESTYGGRAHDGVEMLANDLLQVVERTINRGGKLLIPAFSLGRTQTIVYFLHQLIHDGRLKPLTIYVDSPLAAAASTVFKLHPECFDEETALLLQDDPDIFGENLVRYVRTVEESKNVNRLDKPCIVIAGSGMCEAGRIQHHLKNNIENPNNTVLIIGFQAPETLGRRIVEKRPEVRIHDRMVKLNAEVKVLNGFSSHADMNELDAFLKPLAGHVKSIRLVHGEPDQATPLMARMKGYGFNDVAYPERGEKIVL